MSSKKDIHMTLRRSRTSDASGLSQLTRLGTITPCIPPHTLFPWKSTADFTALIERSIVCITAISTITGKIAGFICLDDTPHVSSIPSDSWEKLLNYNENNGKENNNNVKILPYNSLWIKSILSPPSTAFQSSIPDPDDENAMEIERQLLLFTYTMEDLIQELLSTALTNLPEIFHLLVPFPINCSFPPIESFGIELISLSECLFNGSILHIESKQIIPQLQLRLGIIEDYDDFVPELLDGKGLITALPSEFYLDEILKDQDAFHKVIVAEDTKTHRVVGLMCLEASIEDQQIISRQYSTEVFGKLRPMRSKRGSIRISTSDTPNIVRIYFFHIDPQFSLCAGQFLPFIFQEFNFVEYAIIVLPYIMEEPPFLRHFESVPLRKYQPRNTKGDIIPTPEGLWITCRYSFDPVESICVKDTPDVERISSFLEEPIGEFSHQNVAALLEDIAVARGSYSNKGNSKSSTSHSSSLSLSVSREGNLPNAVALALVSYTSGEEIPPIIGVASARRMTVEEMYAIRANYDVDIFVNYYTDAPRDYSATNIHLTPEEGRRKFFRQGMRGILIRSFFVKSVYRCHIQFFVRELLRFTHCEVAILLGDNHTLPYTPLLKQLLRAPPRRVQEKKKREEVANWENNESKNNNDNAQIDGKDVDALGCLFVATRRIIGDRKKNIHTRIIIVGAGTSGLACIHRLLLVPYVSFINIILVSTDGMPTHANQQPYLWSEDRMELLEREHMSLMVGNPIRIIHGSVVDIDTNMRYISIDDGTYEPYDYVILTTGRQYVVSNSICRLHQSGQQPTRGFTPQGTLALSGESAVEKLRQHLHDLDRNPQNISNIVVYGSGLDAFAIATSIVNLGFSPQRIVVVSPELTNPFIDKDAFECVVKMWNSLGSNTLRGYKISRMEYDDDGNALTTVVISPVPMYVGEEDTTSTSTGLSNSVELSCSLIVCCEDKDIDSHVLSTLNRRSIVFDGRVIVESNYRTTDKHVYAAGPVAMFTRRYGTTPNFDDFNARDVGSNLAEVILGILGFEEYIDPNLENTDDKDDEMMAAHNELYTKVLKENGSRGTDFYMDLGSLPMEDETQRVALLKKKLPVYNLPLTSRIRLPGNYIYFSCRKVAFDPNKCLRLSYSCIEDNKPSITGIAEFSPSLSPTTNISDNKDNKKLQQAPEQNLLVIYINEETNHIDGVIYFGNGKPELYHYMSLIGLPQSLLNLIYRFDEARITNENNNNNNNENNSGLNLMEYLRSPKLQIIFYDRFVNFYKELRERMREHEEVVNTKIRVLEDLNNKSKLSKEKRTGYLKALTNQKNAFTRQVQYELLKFLHESKDYLPQTMYLPDISAHVQRNSQNSPQ